MPTLCTAGETVSKGDAVCVTSFDATKERPLVKRATRSELLSSKTVFGVAENDATGDSVSVLVAGEVAEHKITNLGAGGSQIVVTDISNPDPDPKHQCRLKRIALPTPTPEGFVVGTCDENGNLVIQPRHSSYETGFSKVHNVRAYGAVPDWDGTTGTDNLAAFNKAILAATNDYLTSANFVKILAEGLFYLSDTLHIPRGIILEGIGNGDPTHNPGTMLVFPADVTGIRIHSVYDQDIPAEWLPPVGVAGAISQIRSLTVFCKQDRGEPPFKDKEAPAIPSNGFTGHGIHSNIVCTIKDVTVSNFAENGIFIASEGPPIDINNPKYPGNAGGTHIINTSSNQNGAHGFHFQGINSNVSLIEMCYADINWGNGFRDEGGSGNTYVACYCQGNLGEPRGYSEDSQNHDFYVAHDYVNQSVFLGCYSEASIDHIYAPAGAIGGLLSQGTFAKDSNGFALTSGGVATIGPLITEYKHDPDGPRVEIGDCSENKRALSFIARKSGLPVDFLYLFYQHTLREPFHDWWEWQSSGAYRPIMRFPTAQSEIRHPAPWMPNGLFIGRDDIANNPIHMTAAPSPPTKQYDGVSAQEYEVGDIIWNSEPSPGEPIGQVCINRGTPETSNSPTFSPFGEVTNVGRSTSYASNTQLTVKDRYVTVIETEAISVTKTLTLSASPVDGQTHSIKSQAGTLTRTGVNTRVETVDGLLIDGQTFVNLSSGEYGTFRYSAAAGEWEQR